MSSAGFIEFVVLSIAGGLGIWQWFKCWSNAINLPWDARALWATYTAAMFMGGAVLVSVIGVAPIVYWTGEHNLPALAGLVRWLAWFVVGTTLGALMCRVYLGWRLTRKHRLQGLGQTEFPEL